MNNGTVPSVGLVENGYVAGVLFTLTQTKRSTSQTKTEGLPTCTSVRVRESIGAYRMALGAGSLLLKSCSGCRHTNQGE